MRQPLAILCLLLVVAPAGLLAEEARTPWQCPAGYAGQSLSVANWPQYFAEDTLANFETACGVTLNYEEYLSNEQLLERLRAGGAAYDVVVPTGYAVSAMIRDGLLQPLDHAQLPNLANIRPALLDAEYDPGNRYSAPYQWGTIAVGYLTEQFPDGLRSWRQVWAHDGPVSWIEDQRMMFGFALILLGHDPNTEDAEQIAEAGAYLQQRSGNLFAIATDDFRALLSSETVDIALAYDGHILSLIEECACDTYAYALLAEATGVWVDNLAIPADAANPALAMAFIDYLLDPQVGADISNATAYASPNQAAIDAGLIDEELRQNNPGYSAASADIHFFSIVERSARQEQLYHEAWQELLRAIGNG